MLDDRLSRTESKEAFDPKQQTQTPGPELPDGLATGNAMPGLTLEFEALALKFREAKPRGPRLYAGGHPSIR